MNTPTACVSFRRCSNSAKSRVGALGFSAGVDCAGGGDFADGGGFAGGLGFAGAGGDVCGGAFAAVTACGKAGGFAVTEGGGGAGLTDSVAEVAFAGDAEGLCSSGATTGAGARAAFHVVQACRHPTRIATSQHRLMRISMPGCGKKLSLSAERRAGHGYRGPFSRSLKSCTTAPKPITMAAEVAMAPTYDKR